MSIGTYWKTQKSIIIASNTEGKSAHLYDVPGRVVSIRKSSRKLLFLDLGSEGKTLQVMLSYQAVAAHSVDKVPEEAFYERCRILRRGDHVVVRGLPHITAAGEGSLKAVQLPTLAAPCLQRYPVVQSLDTSSPEHSELDRHVEMLTYPHVINTLKLRSHLIQRMRTWLTDRNFTEVQTPILGGIAGGATARPFDTTATEFADRKISLRIAPELWLKRLIIGGMPRVFEIGPSFRNEGLDKTHNPEFTTCEFYAAYVDLTRLMYWTEALLQELQQLLEPMGLTSKMALYSHANRTEAHKFAIIDFIPSSQRACLGTDLRCLRTVQIAGRRPGHTEVQGTLRSQHPLPFQIFSTSSPLTTSNLSAPKPTWITHIPECMSPLSKSFEHPLCPKQATSRRPR